MSGFIRVYVVSFEPVRAAFGSCDASLLARCLRPGDPPGLRAAVQELVFRPAGATSWSSTAVWLTLAHERLCETFGRAMPDDPALQLSLAAIERVDATLTSLGLETLQSLIYGGGPIRGLPWPDDFPSMGRWEPEKTASVRERFHRMAPKSDDPVVDGILVCMGEWLDAAEPGMGLVALYE